MPIPEHEPLPPTTPAPPSHPASAAASGPAPAPSKWGPYSGAADFTANMATILVALFCALFLAVAANAVVRHFVRRRRARLSVGLPVTTGCKEAPAARCEAITLPVLVFSRRGTTLAGDGPPECAICLSEFADGDRVRVIPACNHGFHVSCVEAWLASTPSCPTCRSSCKADAASGGNSGAGRACTVGEPTTQSGAADERAPMAPSMHGR